jgi:hypothetical protein
MTSLSASAKLKPYFDGAFLGPRFESLPLVPVFDRLGRIEFMRAVCPLDSIGHRIPLRCIDRQRLFKSPRRDSHDVRFWRALLQELAEQSLAFFEFSGYNLRISRYQTLDR